MKVLECTQHYTFMFSNSPGQRDGIWQKFKLTQAFIVVLVTCKNDEDLSKTESTRLLATFLPL